MTEEEALKAVEQAKLEVRVAQITAAQAQLAAEEATVAVQLYANRLLSAERILAILQGNPEPQATLTRTVATPAGMSASAPAPEAPPPAGPSVFEQAQAAAAAGDPLAKRSTAGEDRSAPPPANRNNGPICPGCGTPGTVRATMIHTKAGMMPGLSCSQCGHQKLYG
jgi:hypothetical protein